MQNGPHVNHAECGSCTSCNMRLMYMRHAAHVNHAALRLGGGLGSLEGTYGTTIAIQYSVPNSDANSICDNHLTSKPSMSPSTRGAANVSEPSNALGRHSRSNAYGSSWKEWPTQESYSAAMLQLASLTLPNLLAVKLFKRQPVAMIF